MVTTGAREPLRRSLFFAPAASRRHRPNHRLGDVAQFFDNQRRRVLIDNLVDRDHRAHIEQDLDDFIALDRHLLCKLGNGNALRNFHFVDYRRGWRLETVLRIATHGNRAPARRRLAFAPATLVAGNMQVPCGRSAFRRASALASLFLSSARRRVRLGLFEPRLLFGSSAAAFSATCAPLLQRTSAPALLSRASSSRFAAASFSASALSARAQPLSRSSS